MSTEDVKALIVRLKRDIKIHAESGSVIINRDNYDTHSLRTAANQFREAAKAADELDGVYQTLYLQRLK